MEEQQKAILTNLTEFCQSQTDKIRFLEEKIKKLLEENFELHKIILDLEHKTQ